MSQASARPGIPPSSTMNSAPARTRTRMDDSGEPDVAHGCAVTRSCSHRCWRDEAEHQRDDRRHRDHDRADVADPFAKLSTNLLGRKCGTNGRF
jgi:hypothetical protein